MARRLVAHALLLALLALLVLAGPTLAAEEATDRAIMPPRSPSTAEEDHELTVDEVRTNEFPKVTVRFSIDPIQGRAPTYLGLHDVFIVNDGILEVPLEAHTVGKVPTSGRASTR